MNLQRNRFLLVVGGVCGTLLLIEVVSLVSAYAGFSKEKKKLSESYRRLSQLDNRAPFPSIENVKVLEENRDALEYHSVELVAGLKRDPFPQDTVEATEFSARAQDVIERFRRRAERSGVKLPESLEVGFAKYASGGAVPAVQYVPRLSRQLYSMERVADVLVRSGVDSIDSLTRDFFETESRPDQVMHGRRRSGTRSVDRKSAYLTASKVHPDNLYYSEQIGVVFSASEDVVWRVLDMFAATPHVMAISEFSHKANSTILKYNPDDVVRGREHATQKYLSEGILTGEHALSRSERIITGNETVQVRLVVNVFNFDLEPEKR
jgi:hypothetical protein